MEKFEWELVLIRRHESGCIVVFGFPLLGGWIPFIGFTKFYNNETDQIEDCFLLEWFCHGFAIQKGSK